MSESHDQTQVLGQAGEPCRACKAPLAADQRYCLNCGERRAAPRLEDFRAHLPASAASAAGASGAQAGGPREANGAPASPSGEGPAQRDYTPLAAVAGIAVLGLMLLVGVLIGKGDGSASPPPPVVRIGGEGSGETAANDGSAEAQATPKKTTAKASGKGGKREGGQSAVPDTGDAVEASDEDLEALQEQSPEEYQKSSAKLPDEIATGGAPPPTDSKAPGGGSQGTAIE